MSKANEPDNEPDDNDWETKMFYTLTGIAVGMTLVMVLSR